MKNKEIAFLFTVVLIAITMVIISFKISSLPYSTPDENIPSFFSQNLIKEDTLKYSNTNISQLSSNMSAITLIPRGTYLINQYIVPLQFPAWIYLLATFESIHPSFLFFIMPISYLMILLFSYVFLKSLFNKNYRYFVFLIFLILPTTVLWSTMLFNNIIVSFIFIIGIFCFLKFVDSESDKYLILSSIFLFSSVFFRYEYFLFVAPLFFFVFFSKKRLKNTIIFFSIGLIYLVSILLINNLIFDSPFTTPYTIKPTTTYGKEFNLIPRMSFDAPRLYNNILNHFINIFPAAFVIAILGLFIKIKKNFKEKKFIILILLCIIPLIFYGINLFFGYSEVNTSILFSSYSRYWLGVYFLETVFLGLFFKYCGINKKIKILISFFLVVLLILPSLAPDNKGVYFIYKEKSANQEFVDWVLANIEPDKTLILSIHADEKLFPIRLTGTLDPSFVSFYKPDISNMPLENLAYLQAKDIAFLSKNYDIYLIEDGDSKAGLDISSINKNLNNYNLKLVYVETKKYNIFKLVKSDGAK